MVTLSGIVSPVMVVFSENASGPMVVTGQPPSSEGTVTCPSAADAPVTIASVPFAMYDQVVPSTAASPAVDAATASVRLVWATAPAASVTITVNE